MKVNYALPIMSLLLFAGCGDPAVEEINATHKTVAHIFVFDQGIANEILEQVDEWSMYTFTFVSDFDSSVLAITPENGSFSVKPFGTGAAEQFGSLEVISSAKEEASVVMYRDKIQNISDDYVGLITKEKLERLPSVGLSVAASPSSTAESGKVDISAYATYTALAENVNIEQIKPEDYVNSISSQTLGIEWESVGGEWIGMLSSGHVSTDSSAPPGHGVLVLLRVELIENAVDIADPS